MPPPHNGIALAEKINSLICEWEIDKRLFSITLDNASANDSFVEKLRTQLNFRGLLLLNGKFFHVRCCAHILNLIVQDGLKSIDHSVIKVRDCIKYIKGSMARKKRFLEYIVQVGMGGSRRGLRQDVPTRWNSTYLMLDSAIYYRRALINFALSDIDYSLIIGIAIVMDPRYKMEFVEWAYSKLYGVNSEQLKQFTDTLFSLFDVYVEKWSNPDNSSGFMSVSCSQTEGEDTILEEFDASYKNGSTSSMKNEFHKYLDEERLERKKELDVLSWWKMEQFRYPILFHMACDVLMIPISTVASESAFSTTGRVLDQYRSSLLPDTVQALLCTRDWIFGKKDQDRTDLEQLTEDVLDLTLEGQSQTN